MNSPKNLALRAAAATAIVSFVWVPILRASEAAHGSPVKAATPPAAALADAHAAPAAAPTPAPAPAPKAPPPPPPAAAPAPAAHTAPAAPAPAPAHSAPAHVAVKAEELTPDSALQQLIDGNRRYADGHLEHPNQTVARRIEVASGQHPFAVIVTCSDSRVSPEIYFDQGLGDLFVVRDAGNVLNDHVIGSVEYAVEHLHASIVLVVGHSKCGAVSAAVSGGRPEGRIASIVDSIRPAVKETRNQSGDKLDNAVRGNARRSAKMLEAGSPMLAHAVTTGELKIFAAHYDLASGRVELIP